MLPKLALRIISRDVTPDGEIATRCAHVEYQPQPDITAYEVALLFPLFVGLKPNDALAYIDGLDETTKRHLHIV